MISKESAEKEPDISKGNNIPSSADVRDHFWEERPVPEENNP
jgi:hypothetical protein